MDDVDQNFPWDTSKQRRIFDDSDESTDVGSQPGVVSIGNEPDDEPLGKLPVDRIVC